jgi:hypothetical protein
MIGTLSNHRVHRSRRFPDRAVKIKSSPISTTRSGERTRPFNPREMTVSAPFYAPMQLSAGMG